MFQSLISAFPVVAFNTIALAGLYFLLRTWVGERIRNDVKHEYDKRMETFKSEINLRFNTELETHKAKLQAENAANMERLKSELQIAAAERQIRFSKLHEKVAETAEGVHVRLEKFFGAARLYTSPVEAAAMGSKAERRQTMAKEAQEFHDYFYAHKLYLPKKLVRQIQELATMIEQASVSFMHGVESGRDERMPGKDMWGQVIDVMIQKAPLILADLEDEFRTLLGVDTTI